MAAFFLYAEVVKAAAMDGNLPVFKGNNNIYGPQASIS
jgi:hypothetical protein